MFKFETPKGIKVCKDIVAAARYKVFCENQGWGLKACYKDIVNGYYIWEYVEG